MGSAAPVPALWLERLVSFSRFWFFCFFAQERLGGQPRAFWGSARGARADRCWAGVHAPVGTGLHNAGRALSGRVSGPSSNNSRVMVRRLT